MSPSHLSASGSSQPPPQPPRHEELWSWSEDGEAVVWADGSTIAFEQEISVILSELGQRGKPPRFGSLILLLAACRGRVPSSSSLDSIIGWPKGSPEPDSPPHGIKSHRQKEILRDRLQIVLDNLARIAPSGQGRGVAGGAPGLPRELMTDRRAKTVLAESVFELAPQAPEGDQELTAAGQFLLRLGSTGAPVVSTSAGGNKVVLGFTAAESYLKDLQALEPGLAALDVSSLGLRLKTGLDALPQEAELDLPAADLAQALLADLEKDPEYAGFSRVVRDIMAALYVSRPPLAMRDTQAVGGISDLSNKGQLHRLLLSELANDDLVLSVRLAMNEALFLCPDPPAQTPPQAMVMLVDSGIRMWGVPRVFALAVALAWISRQCGGQKQSLATFRAEASGVARMNLLNRKGMEEHLGVLDVNENVAGALPAFLAEADKLIRSQAQQDSAPAPDLVVISHINALQDKDFQDALANLAPAAVHLAGVDRDGRFVLERWTPLGRTPVSEAVINLDALFEIPPSSDPDKKPPQRLADPRDMREPEFLRIEPSPLLLPVSGSMDYVIEHGGTGVGITTEGRIWIWENRLRGAWEIPKVRCRGKTVWAGWSNPPGNKSVFSDTTYGVPPESKGSEPHNPGNALILKHRAPPGHITLYTVDRVASPPVVHEDMLLESDYPPAAVWFDSGILYILIKQAVHLYDLRGKHLDVLHLPPHTRHLQGRWFSRQNLFACLEWDGKQARLSTIAPILHGLEGHEIVLLFSTVGIPGPRALTRSGWIVNCRDGAKVALGDFRPLGSTPEHHHVSPDGKALLIRFFQEKYFNRYILDYPQKSDRLPIALSTEAWWGNPPAPSWGVRKRFTHIAPLPNGGLMLRTNKGKYLRLEGGDSVLSQVLLRPEGQSQAGGLPKLLTSEEAAYSRTFRPHVYREDVSFTLMVAEWDDGSRAWLDSRGLLHLQPARTDLPEVTIVLSEPCACWLSDGQVFGPSFFTGMKSAAPQPHFWHAIQAFSRELR